jgi:hypothetical protein
MYTLQAIPQLSWEVVPPWSQGPEVAGKRNIGTELSHLLLSFLSFHR